MIEIPYTRLETDTLQAVIEEFILREGTDYGTHEVSLEDKRAQVRKQLESGKVLITFDPRTENCTLMTREQFKRGKQDEVKQHADGSGNNLGAYEDYSQEFIQDQDLTSIVDLDKQD